MIVGVERFFKAAIVDRNTSISSAALVSSYHLHPIARDVIKRWANEAAEAVQNKGGAYGTAYGQGYQAVQSSSSIVQYHALGLLYLIRQGDRMAVTKMIHQLSGAKGAGGTLRSPFAICMLIRFAAKVMEEDPKCVAFSLAFLLPQGTADSHLVPAASSAPCTSSSRATSSTRATWSTTRPLAPSAT